MKFTEAEVVELVEKELILEEFGKEFEGEVVFCNGVIEVNRKFYAVEYSYETEGYGTIYTQDQEAKRVQQTADSWEFVD